MKVASLFGQGKTVFSFEVFPPKKTGSIDTIYSTLEGLRDLHPDYISVTYGAGGNTADTKTRDIAAAIKSRYGIESVAHLTCVSCSKEDVKVILDDFADHGIENILALRGDINPDVPPKTDFRYASELIEFIRENGDFGIEGACYPEGHSECESRSVDIKNLRHKVDCGAQTLVSQLFFDNKCFYSFLARARAAGIEVPISAGIMPVTNKAQIERMVTMCGASMPRRLARLMSRYADNPDALIDAGVDYAVSQIADLIAHGGEGIHLYTMNNPRIAKRISDSVSSLL
ncbi:MAG: methylenetetrahydrofolate reductase [Clostridia bacterium]|nr:methylenetetrahydrofolate reductase [NAD(P)H] [Clostridia bacterium]